MARSLPVRLVAAGMWARRTVLLPFGAVVAVVTAILVACLSVTDARGTLQLCLPLLVVALAVVPQLGADLAAGRRTEAGLAAVRGVRGLGLTRLVVVEPLVVLVLGTAAGWVLGRLLGRRIDGHAAASFGSVTLAEAAVVLLPVALLLLGAVLLGSTASVRRPLLEQVSPVVRRRGGASPWLVLVALLVVGGLLLAGYRVRLGADARDNLLVAAGPGLLGLTAGIVTVAVLRGVAAVVQRITNDAGLLPWLTARVLADDARRGATTRLCVAGLVVAGVAATQLHATTGWLDDTARVGNGAALRIPFQGGAINALQLTREIDPQGRWLLAGQLITDGTDPSKRVVQLDTARYDRVVGPALADTPAAGTRSLVRALRDGPAVKVGTGARLVVAGTATALEAGAVRRVAVRLDYVDDSGSLSSAQVSGAVRRDGTFRRAASVLRSCGGGCSVNGLGIAAEGADGPVAVRITRLDAAGLPQLDLPWTVAPTTQGRATIEHPGADALAVRFVDDAELSVQASDGSIPIVATPDVHFGDGQGVASVGGDTRLPRRTGTTLALPVVQSSGVLEDLPVAALGAAPTPPVADVFILARGDTPAAVLEKVPESELAQTVGAARTAAARSAATYRATLYALAGLAAALTALLLGAAGTRRRRDARAETRAALRLARVPGATSARAHRWAGFLTFGLALALTVLAVLLGDRMFLGSLALLDLRPSALELVAGVPW